MVEDPAGALQRALVAHLRRSPEIRDLVADRIYDEPPSDTEFNYIRIGNIVVDPLRMDGFRDWDVSFSIEVHARPKSSGRVEATEIVAAVVSVLDGSEATMNVQGFSLDWCEFLTSSVSRAGDGKHYLGMVAFDASLAPIA